MIALPLIRLPFIGSLPADGLSTVQSETSPPLSSFELHASKPTPYHEGVRHPLFPPDRRSQGCQTVSALFRLYENGAPGPDETLLRYSEFKCGKAEAIDYFAGLLRDEIRQFQGGAAIEEPGRWAVVSAPRRSIMRAANHLASRVAVPLGLPYVDLRLEESTGGTRNYSKLSREERRRCRKEFRFEPQGLDLLEGRKIILIDDCVTTGSTIALSVAALSAQCRPLAVFAIALLSLEGTAPEREHAVNTAWLSGARCEDFIALLNHPGGVVTKYAAEHLLNLDRAALSGVLAGLSREGIEKLLDAASRHRSDGHELPQYDFLRRESRRKR